MTQADLDCRAFGAAVQLSPSAAGRVFTRPSSARAERGRGGVGVLGQTQNPGGADALTAARACRRIRTGRLLARQSVGGRAGAARAHDVSAPRGGPNPTADRLAVRECLQTIPEPLKV